ncbi:MAG: hypothetical protein O7A98_07010 [Acidobacteria bacterium]|nr:hypothetical protein [Acidobacteriota bacterium]
MHKTNIRLELQSLDEFWSQKVLGEANGTLIKVAKGIGEVNWHKPTTRTRCSFCTRAG